MIGHPIGHESRSPYISVVNIQWPARQFSYLDARKGGGLSHKRPRVKQRGRDSMINSWDHHRTPPLSAAKKNSAAKENGVRAHLAAR